MGAKQIHAAKVTTYPPDTDDETGSVTHKSEVEFAPDAAQALALADGRVEIELTKTPSGLRRLLVEGDLRGNCALDEHNEIVESDKSEGSSQASDFDAACAGNEQRIVERAVASIHTRHARALADVYRTVRAAMETASSLGVEHWNFSDFSASADQALRLFDTENIAKTLDPDRYARLREWLDYRIKSRRFDEAAIFENVTVPDLAPDHPDVAKTSLTPTLSV